MSRTERKTATQWRVLEAIARLEDEWKEGVHGLRICRETGLKSGTVYPMLREFKARKLVSRRKEEINPKVEGRPARTFYSLTPSGQRMLGEYREIGPARGWSPSYA